MKSLYFVTARTNIAKPSYFTYFYLEVVLTPLSATIWPIPCEKVCNHLFT